MGHGDQSRDVGRIASPESLFESKESILMRRELSVRLEFGIGMKGKGMESSDSCIALLPPPPHPYLYRTVRCDIRSGCQI
jgi:hypothetical protein